MVRLVKGLRTKRDKAKIDTWAPDHTVEAACALLASPGHEFFEVLHPSAFGKLYLDRDEILPEGHDELSNDIGRALIESRRAHVHERMRALLGALPVSYKVAERHGFCAAKGRWKLSFRPYVSGIRIRYPDIPRLLAEQGANADGFWDVAVYKPGEQLVGCVNGVKGAQDRRILRPQLVPDSDSPAPRDATRDTEHIVDYLIQVVDDTWPIIQFETLGQLMGGHAAGAQAGHHAAGGHSRVRSSSTVEFIVDLLNCLSLARVTEYAQWRSVGFILSQEVDATNEADLLSAFLNFSARAPRYNTVKHQDDAKRFFLEAVKKVNNKVNSSNNNVNSSNNNVSNNNNVNSNHNVNSNNNKVSNGEPTYDNNKVTLGTLHYMARQDNLEMYNKVVGGRYNHTPYKKKPHHMSSSVVSRTCCATSIRTRTGQSSRLSVSSSRGSRTALRSPRPIAAPWWCSCPRCPTAGGAMFSSATPPVAASSWASCTTMCQSRVRSRNCTHPFRHRRAILSSAKKRWM